jgi:hypothetical protein
VHRLEFTLDDPSAVTGAIAADDGGYTVEPEVNRGVRLLLRAR